MSRRDSKLENTIFADHLESGPYERVFLAPGQEGRYIRNDIDFYDGAVEYDFRIAEYFNVDSIEAVYDIARVKGIPILQPRTENIMGAQGRLALAPGYIVELAEATNAALFHPSVEGMGLPDAQA